jgi:hypothetical protein
MLVPLESPKASFTANATIFRKVDANASTPLTPLPHFWPTPSQVWPLSCFHPPPLDEGEENNLYILSGNEIFLRPLPFFTIFSAMVSSSTSCISSESQPPSPQPTFHPLVLKSWIISGLDLTYSFLSPYTSITFLKSRKARELLWS